MGQSKAQVAADVVKAFAPSAHITAYQVGLHYFCSSAQLPVWCIQQKGGERRRGGGGACAFSTHHSIPGWLCGHGATPVVIVPIPDTQANVKEARFGLDYVRGFDIVLNGLDNMDARRHVNRCEGCIR